MADRRAPTHRSIDKSVTIRATVDAVWKALTDADELVRWFAPEARVTPGPDGKIFLSWGAGMEGESKISAWEPPRHLQIAFGERPGIQLYVDFYVEGSGGATTVRLVHSGFTTDADWDGEYDSHDRGWAIFLLNLRHALEEHAGRRCVQKVLMRATPLSKPDAWARVVGVGGLGFGDARPRAGDAYRITAATGMVLEGNVEIFEPGRDLALTLANHGGSLLRVNFEGSGDKSFLFGALLLYDVAEPVAEELRASLDRVLAVVDPGDAKK